MKNSACNTTGAGEITAAVIRGKQHQEMVIVMVTVVLKESGR